MEKSLTRVGRVITFFVQSDKAASINHNIKCLFAFAYERKRRGGDSRAEVELQSCICTE
jgi:hypothetical protein